MQHEVRERADAARLDVRIPGEVIRLVEEAAACDRARFAQAPGPAQQREPPVGTAGSRLTNRATRRLVVRMGLQLGDPRRALLGDLGDGRELRQRAGQRTLRLVPLYPCVLLDADEGGFGLFP